MSEDSRVHALVRKAAPKKDRIQDVLGLCTMTGRKHSHTIVSGGPGALKENIGLILSLCPNPRGSQCGDHLKPISVQMSINDRLALLLDLSTLDPPPFKSEAFARWCCQTTIALLARDSKALEATPFLAPGTFLAFTPSIPGLEDLPRVDHSFLEQPPRVVARGSPKFVTNDGQDVDVLVVIYETDRIGPMRIVAKGQKLGALVAFTFRQPAIIQALGISPNSRELGAYLMYEPFQQAWTKALKPSQTLTLCEGGGVLYRNPRVNVTLWLDRYVKEIYPNWVRVGTGLPDLVAIAAAKHSPSSSISASATTTTTLMYTNVLEDGVTQPSKSGVSKTAARQRKYTLSKAALQSLAKPIPSPTTHSGFTVLRSKGHRSQSSSSAVGKQTVVVPKATAQKAALSYPLFSTLTGCKSSRLSSGADAEKATNAPSGSALSKELPSAPSPPDSKPSASRSKGAGKDSDIVIDLTGDTGDVKSRKRKRSLVPKQEKVNLNLLPPTGGRTAKRRRGAVTLVKLEGKGTLQNPYIL